MSDATFDSGVYYSSPTDWYRERPFKVAFAVSVVVHAVLIASLPGLRSVPADSPPVLQVEIMPDVATDIPLTESKQVVPPRQVAPQEHVPQPRRLEPPREPLVQKQPEPPPTEIVQAPQAELKPEFVLPKVEPPAPVVEPKIEARPEPKVEPLPPVAKTEPPPQPAIERAPDPLPDTRSNIVPDARPVPREPAVVAPQTKVPDDSQERASTDRYRQMISAKIREYQEYPPVAKKRRWEGTTVVQLHFTAEGKVGDISVSEKSGHDVLDEAAIKMVRSAAPLPTPPEGLRSVLVPIKFRLDS